MATFPTSVWPGWILRARLACSTVCSPESLKRSKFLERFIQAWMYHGVIYELFGDFVPVVWAQFCRVLEDGRKVLSSSCLTDMVSALVYRLVANQGESGGLLEATEKFMKCFHQVIEDHFESSDHDRWSWRPILSCELVTSIKVLCVTISSFLGLALDAPDRATSMFRLFVSRRDSSGEIDRPRMVSEEITKSMENHK